MTCGAPAPLDDDLKPVSAGFIATLTLAYVGAFTAFVPLLSLLVPLRVQTLAPLDKIGLLSMVTLLGAVVASGSNLAVGWASDRTRHKLGRRRPWIVAGLLGVILTYILIANAATSAALVIAVMVFQLAFNMCFAPLIAVLADRVPHAQKGRVAAFLGLGAHLGAASGVVITVVHEATTRLTLLGLLVTACLLPFLLTYRELPAPRIPQQANTSRPRLTADFGFAWLSRFLLQIAASIVTAYMLFYLADYARYSEQFPGSSVESGLAGLITASTLLALMSGFVGGLASDRLNHRKPFILLAATLMASGLVAFALWPEWPGPLVGYCLYGLGFGLYTTVDSVLVAEVLPSARNTARDLGIMNLTNTLPTVIAPVMALIALGPEQQSWPLLMTVAAAFTLLGGLAVLGVRQVR